MQKEMKKILYEKKFKVLKMFIQKRKKEVNELYEIYLSTYENSYDASSNDIFSFFGLIFVPDSVY